MTNLEKRLGSSHFSTTGGANKVFKHFAIGKFALMMHCLYCGQWFGLIARRELITQLLQAYEACHWIAPILSLNCSNVFGALFLLGKTLSSPTCSVLNRSNSSHICALAFLPIFISLMLYLPLHHLVMVWFGLKDLEAELQTWSRYALIPCLSLLLSFLGLSLLLRDLRDRLPVILRNSISLNSSAMRGYSRIDTYAVSWQSMPHYPFLQRSTLSCRYSWQKNCFVH